jgi:Zn-dependent peptidase ImmA (M78 family)
MVALAKALGQPISYFTRAERELFGQLSANFFRKVGPDTKRRHLACEVYARWLVETAGIFAPVVTFPAVALPSFEPKGGSNTYEDDEIEAHAMSVRESFGLGVGPISNVVRLLETKGVLVARIAVPDEKIEAFSFWSGPRPFVFLASDKSSSARSRYDAAHELGHLVLHRWVSSEEIADKDRLEQIEHEADRFAAAFLLPALSFPNEVYVPRAAAFVELKRRWKVSIQAMIYRCKDLGIFDEHQITKLYKQVSYNKWRTNEPLDKDLPLEQPILLNKIATLAIESGKCSAATVITELGFDPSYIEQLAALPPGHLAPRNQAEFEPTLK